MIGHLISFFCTFSVKLCNSNDDIELLLIEVRKRHADIKPIITPILC